MPFCSIHEVLGHHDIQLLIILDISITSYDSGGSLGSLSQSLQDLRASRQSWNDLQPPERSSSDRHHSGPDRYQSGQDRPYSGPERHRSGGNRDLLSRDID